MNIKAFFSRFTRRSDRGEGIVGVVVGLAVAALIISVPVAVAIIGSQNSAKTSQLQQQDAELTTVLNRAAQNIQVADSILYASATELVTRGKASTLKTNAAGEYVIDSAAPEGPETITRWVLSSGTFYQQSWENPPATYTHTWQALTATTKAANGQGPGMVLAKDVKLTAAGIFSYFDRDGAAVALEGGLVPAAKMADINRVKINVEAGVLDFGQVANETYVTLRNAQSPSSDYVPAAVCPAVTIAATSTGAPKLDWEAVAGASGYRIHRDGVLVASPAASARTWTDTSVTSSGRVIEYKVMSVVGGVTSECIGVPFRPAVQAPKPIITVLPASAEGSAWVGSGLTQPRITVSWAEVTNATGYELFMREVDPATGAAIGDFTQVNGANSLATSYTWDGPGWGKRYEWYLHVTSRAGGSADSARIQTLTNPEAPTGLTKAADYSTGGQKDTHGINTISWNAVPNATKYEVWRYNSGKSGAASRIATVTGTSATDTVEYGSEYTYYVIAKNNGPRGTNAAGNAVTEERASAPPEATAAKKSAIVTQLQFPPIPDVAPLGTGAANTRDEDGQNRIVWSAARSAQGYHVARQNIKDGKRTCLTGECAAGKPGFTGGTTFREGAARGTQFQYQVMAYNQTGLSRDWSAKETLTQRPAAPQFSVTARPTLDTDKSSFQLTQNADGGNDPANAFCAANSSSCQYQLIREGRAGVWSQVTIDTRNDTGGATMSFNGVPNHEGYTSWYIARSKNNAITNGGWSDNSRQEINTYPGKFSVSAFVGNTSGGQKKRAYLDVFRNDLQGSEYGYSMHGNDARSYNAVAVGASWSKSMGAWAMRATRHPVANDNRPCRDGLPCEANPYQVVYHGGADMRSDVAAPGATYKFTIRAMGDNGWTRSIDTGNVTTPTDLPQFGRLMVVCAQDNYHFTSKLIDFNPRPRYGQWNYAQVAGLRNGYMGENYAVDHYRQYYNGGAWASRQSASQGQPYSYGASVGFDIQAVGNGGWSARIRQALFAAQPQGPGGCAPWGARGDAMTESHNPCYGYNGGCMPVSQSGRPDFRTR